MAKTVQQTPAESDGSYRHNTVDEVRAVLRIESLMQEAAEIQMKLRAAKMVLFRAIATNPAVSHPDHVQNRYDCFLSTPAEDVFNKSPNHVRNALHLDKRTRK